MTSMKTVNFVVCKNSFFYRKAAGNRIKSYICKDEKRLIYCIMGTCHWVLAGWAVFDLLVFVWAWLDDLYYSHDMKNKFKRLKETLTEE